MPSVLFEVQDKVAFIRLNRPDKFNCFNREMSLLVQELLIYCRNNSAIRSILITGSGKAFSAGQDLDEVSDPGGPGTDTILSEQLHPIVRMIREIEKPVMAAVNGVAAGAGANIALCCDIVVASVSASFIQAFSRIGLIPDSGGTYFLPRLVGWQRASSLTMLGDKITAAEAEKMGMIYKIFEDLIFSDETLKLAKRLSEMPTKALAMTKEALNESCKHTLEQQLQTEEKLQMIAAGTSDYLEGVTAFREKRKPVFKGL